MFLFVLVLSLQGRSPHCKADCFASGCLSRFNTKVRFYGRFPGISPFTRICINYYYKPSFLRLQTTLLRKRFTKEHIALTVLQPYLILSCIYNRSNNFMYLFIYLETTLSQHKILDRNTTNEKQIKSTYQKYKRFLSIVTKHMGC